MFQDTLNGFEADILEELLEAQRQVPAASWRPTVHPGGRRLVPAAVAAAAVAAAVGVVAVSNDHSAPHKSIAARPVTTEIRSAVLAAFDQAAGDVFFTHQVVQIPGSPTMDQQIWYAPWQATAGQQVREHSLILIDGTPFQDSEAIWTQPDSTTSAKVDGHGGRLPAKVTGEAIVVDYSTRSWSDQKSTSLVPFTPAGSADIRHQVATGDLAVVGPVEINGENTIELQLTGLDGMGTSHLWVDASTYLPVRSVLNYEAGSPSQGYVPGTISDDYKLLPPTPASMAQLTPAIPSGFANRVGPPATPHG